MDVAREYLDSATRTKNSARSGPGVIMREKKAASHTLGGSYSCGVDLLDSLAESAVQCHGLNGTRREKKVVWIGRRPIFDEKRTRWLPSDGDTDMLAGKLATTLNLF